jgi:Carboxypeptidase regulatory-like domain/TonB dependent receptor-like, beta-barrel
MKLMLKLLLLSFVIVCLTALAFAQGAASGDLHVTVKDPSGKVVTNATVIAIDQARGTARTAPGNSSGDYRLIALTPGQYTVTVSAPGFAKAEVKNLAVTVGLMADLPITLSVAGAQEVVTVNSEAELVETSRSSTTDTINQRRIDNLPINGRNYINFTLTDSQVVRDNAPNIGAAPTSGLNMSGQRARANLVNVDGADAIDNSVNGVRSTVSQEAVQEFQILTNGYAAEYGRASGGVVNIITRSGSNAFHGDAYGYIRNRNFQATNPFSNVSNPAYTRVQAGTAFGGPIKKDKTYYYFSYEVTRRHETGFSSIGQNNFGLVDFDATPFLAPLVAPPPSPPLPPGSIMIQVTPDQSAFLRGLTPAQIGALGGPLNIGQYVFLLGTSSGMAVNGAWPAVLGGLSAFPTTRCPPAPACLAPPSFLGLGAQAGNFPIFEGTSLYSLRLDHNVSKTNRLMLRANVSPSTVTGIEVNGQNQTFGQNAFSRTSQQTYRDVAGTVQDTWTFGTSKINEFRFQFARRGLSYFFSSGPGGSNIAVNIPGFGFFGREPYSFIDRIEKRYQVTDNFSWAIGRHDTKFGVDYNYIPVTATFTVNYGAVYTFGARDAAPFVNDVPGFPAFSPVQAYGLGIPNNLVQGIGNPKDNFKNQPLGLFWQDSWKVRSNLTLNYGLRYDIEYPPKFAAPTGLALAAYNQLGLQKGIQTDKNNFQPRIGLAWDPHGDGKSVFRASYGLFYDHPLLGLYFLGDASDGSKSGQLLFPGASPCTPSTIANPLTALNATNIFQGILNQSFCLPTVPGYLPNEQRFDAFNANLFLNQNYLSAGFPLAFQPFGYPQAKNFVYAYSHQANLTFEHDLGHNMSLSVAYNFNGGRHLNRPINANTVRGDLLVRNWQAIVAADPTQATTNPLFVTGCGVGPAGPFIPAALVNFFRPSGLNASVANFFGAAVPGGAQCVGLAQQVLGLYGLNATCDPTTLTNCVPFSDMAANYSNGSSVYHGLTANFRKRFGGHTEFLGSYTWSHAIDDSTDLQSPLAPQDSFFPSAERSNSLFDQRHRFVFSGVYQSGRVSGSGFASKLLSNWTFAPIIEVASGRPFNILTGNPDNFQFSPTTGRPNVVPAGTPPTPCSPTVPSSFSQSGFFQEPCYAVFAFGGTPTLQALDGNFARNGGVKPWTVFNDLRVSRRVYFGERVNLDLIADMFNIANRFNVADVNQIWTNAGQPTASYDPRQFQFAMKVNW